MGILAFWPLFGIAFLTPTVVATAVIIGGSMYMQRQTAKSTASRQRKEQEAAAKSQAEFAGQQRAIAGAPISAEQMKMVMGQREIENLVDKFYEQDRTEPEIYTLPTAEPTSPIERINQAISDFFRK